MSLCSQTTIINSMELIILQLIYKLSVQDHFKTLGLQSEIIFLYKNYKEKCEKWCKTTCNKNEAALSEWLYQYNLSKTCNRVAIDVGIKPANTWTRSLLVAAHLSALFDLSIYPLLSCFLSPSLNLQNQCEVISHGLSLRSSKNLLYKLFRLAGQESPWRCMVDQWPSV